MEGCSNSCSSSSSSAASNGSASLMDPAAAPVTPKTPPLCLDLYGKRRQLVKLKMLEKEIGSIQEELKSVDTFQPASRCCKELDDFIGAKPDPFIAINEKRNESKFRWKSLCCSIICCFKGCERPKKWCGWCCGLCNSNFHICCQDLEKTTTSCNGSSCCRCSRLPCRNLYSCCRYNCPTPSCCCCVISCCTKLKNLCSCCSRTQ